MCIRDRSGADQSGCPPRACRRNDRGAWPRLAWNFAARSDWPRAGGRFQPQGFQRVFGPVGQRVAAKGVTVLDDGTMADRRGSLNVDDEGNISARNVLIEDGILKGYI